MLFKRLKLSSIFGQNQRFLFTDDFMGISMMKEKQRMTIQDFSDKDTNIQDFRSRFFKDKEPILMEDLSKLVLTTKGKDETLKMSNYFHQYVLSQEELVDWKRRKLVKIFKDLVSICHAKNSINLMEPLFQDAKFKEKIGFMDERTGLFAQNVPTIYLIYFDKIYEDSEYDKVLEEFDKLSAITPTFPWPILTLVMMSCLRLNTSESYQKATEIYNNVCDDKSRGSSRISHPYALLAFKQGKVQDAYEIVSNVQGRSTIKLTLQIHFLTQMKRLHDAIGKFEHCIASSMKTQDLMDKRKGEKMRFSIEAVQGLTEAVEQSGDKALQVKLAKVFKKMDAVAAISSKDLMETVTEVIDVTNDMKYRREKNRLLRQKKETPADEAIEEIDEEQHEEILDQK